jgi:two-component system KDP operon response regulator KdpE
MKPDAKRLLIIDDEPDVRRFLRLGLEPHSYHIEDAVSGKDGIAKAVNFKPELVVLDLGLPDMDGLEVLKTLRGWTKVPILVLTVRDSDEDKVALLEAGADDYLTKPFSMPELVARLKVALRHSQSEADTTPVFKTGGLEVDFASRSVKIDGRPVKLTTTEYNVLRLLAQARGRIVTQQQLLNDVWGPNASESIQYLRVYIGALRKKLELDPAAPRLITTDPGVGYRLNVESGS